MYLGQEENKKKTNQKQNQKTFRKSFKISNEALSKIKGATGRRLEKA